MATEITMPLSDWQEKQNRIETLEREMQETLAELEEARLGSSSDPARLLAAALGYAMPIVHFAVANCAPRMFPGWPYKELAALAKLLPDLPGVDGMIREQATDLGIYAKDAAEWEEARAAGTHEVKFLEENAARGLHLPEGSLDGAAKIIK
jgi:hypothetical protein